MKITIAHRRTLPEAIQLVDKGANGLFAGAAGPSVEIVDQQKEWEGNVMNFSFTGKMGFITVPLHGTITVDDVNILVDCELPALVKNFIGDARVSASIEKKIQLLLDKPDPA
jgi:hypothetical protein